MISCTITFLVFYIQFDLVFHMEEVLQMISHSPFWSGCHVFIENIEQNGKANSLLVVFFFYCLVQIMWLLTLQEVEVLEVKMSIKVWCSLSQKIRLPYKFSFHSFSRNSYLYSKYQGGYAVQCWKCLLVKWQSQREDFANGERTPVFICLCFL